MNTDRLLKPPSPEDTNPLYGARIFKLKLPGKKAFLIPSYRFKKQYPKLWKRFRDTPLGETKIISAGKRTRARVGAKAIHPREMTPQARAKICPAGIRGQLRRAFIEDGITPKEFRTSPQYTLNYQRAIARTLEEYYELHPEELGYKIKRREKRQQSINRELVKQGKPPKVDYSKLISPARIAKTLDVDPFEVRKFLRAKGVGKRGGRYAFKKEEAKKIIRAFRKEQSEGAD